MSGEATLYGAIDHGSSELGLNLWHYKTQISSSIFFWWCYKYIRFKLCTTANLGMLHYMTIRARGKRDNVDKALSQGKAKHHTREILYNWNLFCNYFRSANFCAHTDVVYPNTGIKLWSDSNGVKWNSGFEECWENVR